ncbi:MAG: radical SAM protein [Lachnospiraceae bacterium]|nr:radical SAM protein [Lachnospiraceae bacterium]
MEDLKLPILAIERLRMMTDGEGVTTLICSMNCPLRCRLCINPYTWDGTKASEVLSVDGLYERVKIDNLYFQTTGGGLTFGGGEPLVHSKFHAAFMEKYQSTGWAFNLESSLQAPFENLERVIPYISCYAIDVKDMEPERYREYTGGDFQVFFDNLMKLKDRVEEDKIILKIPKIPYLHKGDEQKENEEKLRKLGFSNIVLFNYVDPKKRKKLSETALENRGKLITE